jgi:hypothetical protein
MKIPKTKPLRLGGQGLRYQRLKSFNAPIIANSRAKSQVLATKNKVRPTDLISKNQDGRIKYKQIVHIFKYSGGHNEADTYLIHWCVSPIFKSLLLAYAEYDALMSGVCDE